MFCENCGVRDGETDEQAWNRMGYDPTNATFEQEVFTVTYTGIGVGYFCQYCTSRKDKMRYYNSFTGMAITGYSV